MRIEGHGPSLAPDFPGMRDCPVKYVLMTPVNAIKKSDCQTDWAFAFPQFGHVVKYFHFSLLE
jgi:hypothetical protein